MFETINILEYITLDSINEKIEENKILISNLYKTLIVVLFHNIDIIFNALLINNVLINLN